MTSIIRNRVPSTSRSITQRFSRTQTLTSLNLHSQSSRCFHSSRCACSAPTEQALHATKEGEADWETRYQALKQKRQAEAITRWQELQELHPEISFPSPDGTDRPSQKVVSIVNKIFTLSVLESYQLAHMMDKVYGFSASAAPAGAVSQQASAAPAAAAAEPAKEAPKAAAQSTYSIRLDGFDAANKIKVIKEVRGATGLGLKESKELVEGAPKTIKGNLNKADCDALVAKLKEAGAKITVE